MYCPKCGTENLDTARYCRSCGADISLVPQALTGRLPVVSPQSVDAFVYDSRGRRRRRKGTRPPRLEKVISQIFMGLAFLIVSLVLSRSPIGFMWWYWMLIPSFAMLGGGVSEYIRLKQSQQTPPNTLHTNAHAPASFNPSTQQPAPLPPRNTSEIFPQPPSITENTTRHLGAEAQTKYIDEEEK